jgi:hypothetical protein
VTGEGTAELEPVPTGPERVLAAVYDAGAEAYQRYWAPALHRHTRALLEALPAVPAGHGRTVLDVGGGTGTLAPELRSSTGSGGPIVVLDRSHFNALHCAACQPQIDCAILECARCGEGPILTGALADQLHEPGQEQPPAALRTWLTTHGWQLAPQLLCPDHHR